MSNRKQRDKNRATAFWLYMVANCPDWEEEEIPNGAVIAWSLTNTTQEDIEYAKSIPSAI